MNEKNAYHIAVIAGRDQSNCYDKVMPAIIKLIDVLHSEDEGKNGFVFLHNGVFSGNLKHVQATINVIGPSLTTRGFYVGLKKLPMDVLGHGRVAEQRWLDSTLEKKPEAFLLLDDGQYDVYRYSDRVAKENNIYVHRVDITQR